MNDPNSRANIGSFNDQVRAHRKIRPPLPSSLIEPSGYHGLMTPREPLALRRPLTVPQVVRVVANAVNGSTVLGVAVALAARTELQQGPRGLIIAGGYRWRVPFAGAFTLGNVILCRCTGEDLLARPGLLGHEEKHCSQYAWCLGVPFLPLYFLAAGWSLLRTGNPGTGNFFERHAGLVAGGYPVRATRRGLRRIRLPGMPGSTGREA
jgi:hypothetical protein